MYDSALPFLQLMVESLLSTSRPTAMSVVNWQTTSEYDVYIGRFVPGGPAHVKEEECIYGNPFVLVDVEDEQERTECLAKYEQWLLQDDQRELVSPPKAKGNCLP